MKMVMEQSLNMKIWPKVMEFCDQSLNSTNFAPKLDQICIYFVTTKKLSSNLESHVFVANAKSGREMVMENQEMVMDKSWENISSSMWELCK